MAQRNEDAVEDYVVAAPVRPSLPVLGTTARFPVGRIFCVGRNYAEHAREMGASGREAPFFFQKQADMVVADGAAMAYPRLTDDLHHEGELVLALGAGGADVAPEDAAALIYGYAAGIDFTRRDRQAEMKERRGPWEIGKAFDDSAPVGTIVPAADAGDVMAGTIELAVGGAVRQSAPLSQMIWPPAALLAELSKQVTLKAGDLIFTGTPAGVAAVAVGDVVTVTVTGLPPLTVPIVAR